MDNVSTPVKSTPTTPERPRRRTRGQWFMAALTLLAGVLLIVFHNHLDAITWIVEGMGWLIILSGLYLVISNALRDRELRSIWQQILGVFALGMGIWIAVTPSTFANLLIYIFAVVLILAGLWNVVMLRTFGHDVRVPLYYYILPAFVIVAGAYFLVIGAQIITNGILLIMGIALVISSVVAIAGLVDRKPKRPAA